MKAPGIISVILVFILPFFSLSQSWSWEKAIPNSTINDMKTLSTGTSIITGSFPGIQPVDSASPADYFLLKIDSSGNIVGGIKKAATLLQTGLHVGADANGNIYVAGTPFTPQANNYYLQKYNTRGQLLWSIRLFIEGNIAAMDVNHGRVALIGTYKKVMRVYDTSGVTIRKSLGEICDPEYEFPCSFKNDVFIANFNMDGNLFWAEKYYSQMQSGYVQDENYYFTKKDYNDAGLDISIDKDQHILFVGAFSAFDPEPTNKAVIAGVTIDVNVQDNYPPTLIKLNPYGEYMWSYNAVDAIFYGELPKRIKTDNYGNSYMLYEYFLNIEGEYEGLIIKVQKRNSNGQMIWERNIKPTNPDNSDLFSWGWSWYMDSLGNSQVAGRFTYWVDSEEYTLVSFDKDNNLVKDYGSDPDFNSKYMGKDADRNIYFSIGNKISKYISENPASFEFTGNGEWSNISNWKGGQKPGKEIRKWDTVYISTTSGDSCVLDVPQTILPGGQLMVMDGSRFIVPDNIQTDPLPKEPTPMIVTNATATPATPGAKVHFSIALVPGQNPISTGLQAAVDLTSIGGPLSQLLNDEGVDGDQTAGDYNFGWIFNLPDTVSPGQKIIPFKIEDAQGRKDSGTMILTVSNIKGAGLVISQIYGGGGLSAASFKNDYVEIFNRGNTPVDLNGKSLQYASAAGTDLFSDRQPIPLSGTVQPGRYYLIKLAGGSGGKNLPITPDKTDTLNISEVSGKIVLVSSSTSLTCNGQSTPCSDSQRIKILDLVGYGNAGFFEGNPAPAFQNGKTSSLMRHWDGCGDTDNNLNDFYISPTLPRNSSSLANICTPKVVISQVFSRAGQLNSGPYFDFIELYNAGSKAENISGWSVQYADSASDQWQSTPLLGTIEPGKYYLIKQAFNSNGTNYLPASDAQGGIDLHERSGKVALVKHSVPLTVQCPSDSMADFFGYGNANCFEGSGSYTPTSTSLMAFFRKENGCLDNNDNKTDFLTAPPAARNSASPVSGCGNYTNESLFLDPRDGKLYPIKRYGQKVWMTANLNYVHPNPFGVNYSVYYDNNSANGPIYGRLYTWDAAMGACPSGWHLPSSGEWSSLISTAGGGGALKDTLYWDPPNSGATNLSGFNARPGGTFWNGGFDEKGLFGYWWTSTYFTSTGVIHWATVYTMGSNSAQVSSWEGNIGEIYSVRCVKD